MTLWLDDLARLAAVGPVAMVSVLATEGSAPRGAGTRMLVTADGLCGTIGGGALEFGAVEQARAVLEHAPGTWRVQDYPLGPLLGQCCGGRVRLLVEHVDREALGWLAEAAEGRVLVSVLGANGIARKVGDGPSTALSARGDRPDVGSRLAELIGGFRRPLYLFGAGHVGQAIARHVEGLPIRLAWFDVRPEFEGIAGVTVVPEDAIGGCIAEAPDEAACAILTHDHALDYRLTLAALSRPALAFTGLIGSQTKRARFLARLERDGVSAEALGRLTCPIGLPGVTGKEPDVIAVALLAQVLQLPPVQAVQAVAA
ncbi:xanthine dehydrogenase accessory protein XdhC [Novosphingobium sediminis]|uniref:Xanthine dehydrogenase accessory protein XdhC n=1 Tax=Novosphingobium sediminis TaxID=707214 RepID=A0A512ALS6_9SPHN|nr:xanthine dehydrogenase accessory protein XdhC [Novosphingobium sediminis]GEO00672.1 xanthine dehydrogenase accessory protein XdhC [Novosphingobium sediminis]